MIPTRLLLVALSVASTAQALHVPVGFGVPMMDMEKRVPQATGDETVRPTVTETSAPPPPPPPSESTTATTEETTKADPTPTTKPEETPTPTPTPSPTTPTITPDQNTPTPTPTTATTKAEETTTAPKPTTKADQTTAQSEEESTTIKSTSTITAVITTTDTNGQQVTSTQEIVSTGVATISKDGNKTSGMSTSTRNTIIGVVVGVGGAIILCTVGFVAWRIRNKKKQAEESDGLMSYGGYTAGAAEKPDSLTGTGGGSQASRTPFQSTLESYHAPTQVNQASNF